MKDGLPYQRQAQMTDSRLQLVDAGYAHDGRAALSDLTLDIAFSRLGVVGRNGSGKSTLARLLAGLVRPRTGRVLINGADLTRDRRRALTEVGILFQNPDHQIIFPTVLEEITFGLTQLGNPKAKAEEMARDTLARFGKSHWHEAYTNTLSQGQKHLVCFMAIVAMSPRLLILDEPFAGLDIPTRAQLARYLDLYRGNLIHITHAPEDLDGCAQVLWLDQGRICQSGPRETVLPAYLDEMKKRGEADDISDLSG